MQTDAAVPQRSDSAVTATHHHVLLASDAIAAHARGVDLDASAFAHLVDEFTDRRGALALDLKGCRNLEEIAYRAANAMPVESIITSQDATEIYYALLDKARRIESGEYGRCTCANDPELACEAPMLGYWASHLRWVAYQIGTDGRRLNGVPVRNAVRNVVGG